MTLALMERTSYLSKQTACLAREACGVEEAPKKRDD